MHNIYDVDWFDAYLDGQLEKQLRTEFEQALKVDTELREEFELHRQFRKAIGLNALKKNLRQVEDRLEQETFFNFPDESSVDAAIEESLARKGFQTQILSLSGDLEKEGFFDKGVKEEAKVLRFHYWKYIAAAIILIPLSIYLLRQILPNQSTKEENIIAQDQIETTPHPLVEDSNLLINPPVDSGVKTVEIEENLPNPPKKEIAKEEKSNLTEDDLGPKAGGLKANINTEIWLLNLLERESSYIDSLHQRDSLVGPWEQQAYQFLSTGFYHKLTDSLFVLGSADALNRVQHYAFAFALSTRLMGQDSTTEEVKASMSLEQQQLIRVIKFVDNKELLLAQEILLGLRNSTMYADLVKEILDTITQKKG